MSIFTNNRWMGIVTLALITANIFTLALLWTNKEKEGRANKMPPPQGQVFEFITKELSLDSLQQMAYKKLREEHQMAMGPLQDSIRHAREDFFELLKQPAVTKEEVALLNNKISIAEEQLNLVTFNHFQKLRQLCSADQQKTFDGLIKEVLLRMAPARRPQGPPPGMDNGDRRPPGPPPGMEERENRPPDN